MYALHGQSPFDIAVSQKVVLRSEKVGVLNCSCSHMPHVNSKANVNVNIEFIRAFFLILIIAFGV